MGKTTNVESFELKPGRKIARKYEVVEQLGKGWEGEVYKIVELSTGIERAAKLFYPQRNIKNRTASRYAKKLHQLRHCPIVIQYHTEEQFIFRRIPITVLISEYVEGKILSEFIKEQPGKRLSPFQALHFLYALANGLEQIHHLNEYHGDLHEDNIIIARYGLGFDLKLLDMYHWPDSKQQNMRSDKIDAIKIFYYVLGGQKHYAKQPRAIKDICCGQKHTLINRKFRSIADIRDHLEQLNWE